MEENKQVLSGLDLSAVNGGAEADPQCPEGRVCPIKVCASSDCQYSDGYWCSLYNRDIPKGPRIHIQVKENF